MEKVKPSPSKPDYDQLYEFVTWLKQWTMTIICGESEAYVIRDAMRKYGLLEDVSESRTD